MLTGVMLASLLMAAALPNALGEHGMLFAASYVALQVGRNAAAMLLLGRDHRLRDVFERLLAWSVVSGALWLAGATLDPDQRLLLWIPALGLDLVAPVAGYWLPGRGCAVTTDWDIEGGHFAERCQLFIIIALGESIVVTGATAADAGLTPTVAICLVVAFLETVALWWLYFGAPAERSRAAVSASDDPGRLARDAYTYVHLPIIAGIIATAAGHELLIAEPHDPLQRRGPGDRPRRARPLPDRREPLPVEDDRQGEREAPGGRRADHRARTARNPRLRSRAGRDRHRSVDRDRHLGTRRFRDPWVGVQASIGRSGNPMSAAHREPSVSRGTPPGAPLLNTDPGAREARDGPQAALVRGLGARLGPAVTMATTEHFNLQTARAATISEATGAPASTLPRSPAT